MIASIPISIGPYLLVRWQFGWQLENYAATPRSPIQRWVRWLKSFSGLLDCSAFKKNNDGSWVTTKDTTVYAGLNIATAGWITLPPGAGVNQNVWRPNGVDLIDVLNQKCSNK